MFHLINSLTTLELIHYSNNFLNAVIYTTSQRTLKTNELIHFINYFFLKNLNVNLVMCLYFETVSSCMLHSDSKNVTTIIQLLLETEVKKVQNSQNISGS